MSESWGNARTVQGCQKLGGRILAYPRTPGFLPAPPRVRRAAACERQASPCRVVAFEPICRAHSPRSAVESAVTHRRWKSAASNMSATVSWCISAIHRPMRTMPSGRCGRVWNSSRRWAALKTRAPLQTTGQAGVGWHRRGLPGIARPSSRAARVRRLPDDLICSTIAKNAVVCRVSHCPSGP
jgi:hypothetical protein